MIGARFENMKLGNLFDRTRRSLLGKETFFLRDGRQVLRERETNDGGDDGVELWAIKEREEKEKESSLSLS